MSILLSCNKLQKLNQLRAVYFWWKGKLPGQFEIAAEISIRVINPSKKDIWPFPSQFMKIFLGNLPLSLVKALLPREFRNYPWGAEGTKPYYTDSREKKYWPSTRKKLFHALVIRVGSNNWVDIMRWPCCPLPNISWTTRARENVSSRETFYTEWK